jgi:hypothetical protein
MASLLYSCDHFQKINRRLRWEQSVVCRVCQSLITLRLES